jgi:hypothetical protein
MKQNKLPKTDSIQELAEFWDSHDVTDFHDSLEIVPEPAFERETPIKVRLAAREGKALQKLAKSQGLSREELLRRWVRQKLASKNGG